MPRNPANSGTSLLTILPLSCLLRGTSLLKFRLLRSSHESSFLYTLNLGSAKVSQVCLRGSEEYSRISHWPRVSPSLEYLKNSNIGPLPHLIQLGRVESRICSLVQLSWLGTKRQTAQSNIAKIL